MRNYEISKEAQQVGVDYLLKCARSACENAFAPYSKCKVGVALCSAKTGKVYVGCNVENSSYGATICAERNAITTAVSAEGDIGIASLVVVNNTDRRFTPCGICLEFMVEFIKKDIKIYVYSRKDDDFEVFEYGHLLPQAFIL